MWITTGTYTIPPTEWIEVAEFDNPVAAWRQQSVDLSSYIGQTVWFAFRYEGTDATNWYIDDIEQSYALTPPDGGLVAGFVTDANTSQPLDGASVQIGTHQTQTAATPNDPATDDGFYTIYSPTGPQSATAEKTYYHTGATTSTAIAGDLVRQDFALLPAPYHTISGIAKDPLTGWPVYAQVTCAADGYPSTSTWSNPFTGEYSLTVSAGGDWTVTAWPWLAGYYNATHSIGSPAPDTNVDLSLAPTENAPGYASAIADLSEGFEGGSVPPTGWGNYESGSTTTQWTASAAHARSGSYSAAHMSNPSEYQDGWLVTTATAVTASAPVAVFWEYSENPAGYVKQSMWIKTGAYSAPPTGWTEIAEFDGPVALWRQQTVDLSAHAGQTVYLAFRYEGLSATNWYIDDFEVGALSPPDGGLVGGFVTDADTSQPMNDVTIQAGAEQTQTAATPNDDAIGDGFYTLYSPAGSQSVTADIAYYYPQSQTPTVPSGDIVRQDFALETAANHTLSGTVRDAVTGWPLYAKVECAANGYSSVSAWSDPFTGAYSVSLAATGDWHIAGTTWLSGYSGGSQHVGSLSANTSFTLNQFPTLGAPGYATLATAWTEGFEGNLFVPAGWSTNNLDGDDTRWSSTTTVSHTGLRSASHLAAPDIYQDDWLITSPTTLNSPNATLSFWEVSGWTTRYVKHSLWIKTDATAWTELAEFANPTGSWRQQLVDLSAYSGQTVQLAFRYEGLNATTWYIDDISVSEFTAPTGGLVGGFVTSSLTSESLTGATVAIHDSQTQTATTPDDATVPDSLYFLYAPAGDSPSTASFGAYVPQHATVSVAAGETTRHDYALDAGRLQVNPDSLQVYVAPGNATTRTLTLTNTGTGALDFVIGELDLGASSLTLTTSPPPPFASSSAASSAAPIARFATTTDYAEKRVGGGIPTPASSASDGTARAYVGPAWETMAPLPEGRTFNAVVADKNGYVYVIGGDSDPSGSNATNTNYRYDTTDDSWQEMAPMPVPLSSIDAIEIGNNIYVPGGQTTATTYVYNIGTDSWSSIAANNGYTRRSQYQVVAIGTDLYVLGGLIASLSHSTTEVWILDTITGTWSPGVPMLKSRTSFSAGAIDGNIYVAGGVYYPNWTPDMTTEKCDGTTWTYTAPLPDGGGAYTRWSYNADGIGIDGLWLGAGRRDTDWNVLNHAGYYDPDSDTWTDSPTIPALSQGRVYMEGDVAADGYFYVIGGRDSSASTIYKTNERLQVGYRGATEVPWLSVNQTSGTLAAGASIDIVVTADSSAVNPGIYRAFLRPQAHTPFGTPTTVLVTMVVSPLGQLQVNISPPDAVSDGAQWRIEGENDLQWSDSGDIRSGVPISSQTIEFKDVTGWVTPADQVAVVTTGSLTVANATYAPQTFALHYLAGPGGTVTEPTSQTVVYGEDGVAVTAIADEGYHFTQWTDAVTDNPRQDTNVTHDITVGAEFDINVYRLTYIAGENGTIDGETSRTMLVAHGTDATTVTAMPDPEYMFLRWSDESQMNPRLDTYVTSGATLTAIFHHPAAMGTSQTCTVVSDGHVFAALYNYAIGGNWATWLDNTGGGNLDFNMYSAQWLGFYIYDYNTAAWTRGFYIYKQ